MNPTKAPGSDRLPALFFRNISILWVMMFGGMCWTFSITRRTQLKKKSKGKKGVMALKLDMSKAYDRLKLEFVTNTLETMGFPMSLVPLIWRYQLTSGQVMNLDKSEVSFSKNMNAGLRDTMCNRLGVQVIDNHSKYMGITMVFDWSKKDIFSLVLERVWKKIKGWNDRFVSRVGKEVLIKVVAQDNPSYIMSCYKLPEGICKEIKSMGQTSDAELRLSSSYAWRSILSAKEPATKVTRWRIVYGSKVKSWQDNWISSNPSFKPLSRRRNLDVNAIVYSLIDHVIDS
ncbi:unnamed protein product [Vicia faba]|uniref:Reverse transcriptase n=1 Tax=Vicia faba TaxID=3906 RepID=A0AAV0ZLC9_VICFA|nr:unnamed protein product [Vicia faba]